MKKSTCSEPTVVTELITPAAAHGNGISESSSESHLGNDHPLECVASIAVRLLKGGHHTHYKDAAEQALELMDACQHELTERRRRREIMGRACSARAKFQESYFPTPDGKFFKMPWREALKHITGEKDEARAQPDFKRFLAYSWQASRAMERRESFDKALPPTDKEIEDRITQYKAEGIHSMLAANYKLAFEEWKPFDKSQKMSANGRKRGKSRL